jgi:hypothetical protein
VAIVDQRQVPQLVGWRGVPVNLGPQDVHGPNRTRGCVARRGAG